MIPCTPILIPVLQLGKGGPWIPQEDDASPCGRPRGNNRFHTAREHSAAPRYTDTSSGFASTDTPLYFEAGGGLVLDPYDHASKMPQQSVNTAGGGEISNGSFFMGMSTMSFASQRSMSQASVMEVRSQAEYALPLANPVSEAQIDIYQCLYQRIEQSHF